MHICRGKTKQPLLFQDGTHGTHGTQCILVVKQRFYRDCLENEFNN